ERAAIIDQHAIARPVVPIPGHYHIIKLRTGMLADLYAVTRIITDLRCHCGSLEYHPGAPRDSQSYGVTLNASCACAHFQLTGVKHDDASIQIVFHDQGGTTAGGLRIENGTIAHSDPTTELPCCAIRTCCECGPGGQEKM